MSNATVAGVMSATGRSDAVGARTAAPATCRQMPLSFLKDGESATIAKVRGKGDVHHHLENLGFVEGALVTVMSEAGGDLIVEVKGTHIALNKQVASRIITNAAV